MICPNCNEKCGKDEANRWRCTDCGWYEGCAVDALIDAEMERRAEAAEVIPYDARAEHKQAMRTVAEARADLVASEEKVKTQAATIIEYEKRCEQLRGRLEGAEAVPHDIQVERNWSGQIVAKARAELADAAVKIETQAEQIADLKRNLEMASDGEEQDQREDGTALCFAEHLIGGRLLVNMPKRGWDRRPELVSEHGAGMTMIFKKKSPKATEEKE